MQGVYSIFRLRQSRPCPRCCAPCVSPGCCSPLARAARCRRAQAGAGKDPKQAGHGMWIPPYSVRLDVACPKLAALVWLRYRVVRETCRVLGWQAGTLWIWEDAGEETGTSTGWKPLARRMRTAGELPQTLCLERGIKPARHSAISPQSKAVSMRPMKPVRPARLTTIAKIINSCTY